MNCIAGAGGLPYTVPMADATRYLNTGAAANGGLTNDQIRKATRGIAQTGDVPAITVTPTACIGPDVFFNDVVNSGIVNGQGQATAALNANPAQAVALCDPNGFKPANAAAQLLQHIGKMFHLFQLNKAYS